MMKKKVWAVGLALTLAFALTACGGGKSEDKSAAATGEVKEITVNAKNFEFTPNEIKVKKGDTVKLTLVNESGMHGIEIPDFDLNLDSPGTKEFVADKTGTFDFKCSIMCGADHNKMLGKLVVE